MSAVVLGAVAYDPKVVTIWDGFKAWFEDRDLAFDYILYSNYERQVEALMGGDIQVAWNSPLAWLRSKRLAAAQGKSVRALVMRDTDQDLVSIVITQVDSQVLGVSDLRGRRVAVGSVDSPQATMLPLSHLSAHGLVAGMDFELCGYTHLGGQHGDHIGGERDAVRALSAGEVDAACILDANALLFAREGTLASGSTRVVTQTEPYDHCNLTTTLRKSDKRAELIRELLLTMSYEDADVRRLFDLEGLKEWRPARTSKYAALERAVDEMGFYDASGSVTAADYRY